MDLLRLVMVYLLYLIYSCSIFAKLSQYKDTKYIELVFFSLPVILIWVFIIGGQYYVGTDYPEYLTLFDGNNLWRMENSGEWFFVFFVKGLNYLGLHGQDLFFIVAAFEVFLLLFLGKELFTTKYLFIFFFVFIAYSSVFNNQMNGLRQYVATYLFSLSVLFLIKKRYMLCLFFLVFAAGWHVSAIILPIVLLLFFGLRNVYNKSFLYYILLFSVLFLFIFKEDWLFSFMSLTGFYDQYLTNGYVQEIGAMNKVTKFINLPIIVYSIYKSNKYELNIFSKNMYVVGVCAYCIYLSCLASTIMNRIGMYFTILTCIPVVYLLIYLYRKKSILFWFIVLYLFLIYSLKVTVFASGEYTYKSIFFH